MKIEEIYTRLISELKLVKNKRMAVCFGSLGDFYSLCASIQNAEEQLHKKYILLYCSEVHQQVINAFTSEEYNIECYKMPKEDFYILCGSSFSVFKEYQDYFVLWSFGDEAFRQITRNISNSFTTNLRDAHFPKVDACLKYADILNPKKTVFIIPEAKSIASPPPVFWNMAAQFYRCLGFSVVFNVPPEKANIYDGKCIMLPITDVVEFTNECGYVLGVRTGLFDVLRTSTAQMTIFSTKHYRPLDAVFCIPNQFQRIKTIYYEDLDPFFKKSPIISTIENYCDNSNKQLKQLLFEIIKRYSDVFMGNIMKPANIESCQYTQFSNAYAYRMSGNMISPFIDIEYKLALNDDSIIFQIQKLTPDNYRFDYKIYINDCVLFDLKDVQSNALVCPLKQTGEYFIKATITDLTTYNQERFETNRLLYFSPIPETLDKIKKCNDFHSYISALDKFSSDVTIFISSRDAHTHLGKDKQTKVLHVLRLFNFKTDFENTYRYSFIGVIDGGKIVEEMASANETLIAQCKIDGNDITIESSGYNVNSSDKISIRIEINGINEAVNGRGLNFVVWNKRTNKLIDSVCFDTFLDNKATRKQ